MNTYKITYIRPGEKSQCMFFVSAKNRAHAIEEFGNNHVNCVVVDVTTKLDD